MRATLCARSEASPVPRVSAEPPEQSTDNPRRSRGVDAARTRPVNWGGPPPRHQGFQFSPGAPPPFARGRLDGAVAAQTPAEDGQGSYQLAYKERDRYLSILGPNIALREAAEPSDTSTLHLADTAGDPATSPYLLSLIHI